MLARDDEGKIVVEDKPEYYECTSITAIKDAFSIHDFAGGQPTVYVEGRTDERYFNKTLEVYNCNVPFQFKWVGYVDGKGSEVNTGSDALNRASQFLIGCNPHIKPYFYLIVIQTERVITRIMCISERFVNTRIQGE